MLYCGASKLAELHRQWTPAHIHIHRRVPAFSTLHPQDTTSSSDINIHIHITKMAEPPQQTAAAAFPAPPVFYKNFTLENQRKLEELQAAPASTQSDDGSATESKETASQSLPPELLCLIPPKPPTEGQYRSFGDTWNVRMLSCRIALGSYRSGWVM